MNDEQVLELWTRIAEADAGGDDTLKSTYEAFQAMAIYCERHLMEEQDFMSLVYEPLLNEALEKIISEEEKED